ncbi:hypothetical protein CROQUDRAFT_277512 [Cronartium quercuum f. sp. fusiforme G11]|uniref:Uncharacterized protein n=1 Tax=Cronartium quercuum f. sp. fusiforme G11 TaxID=708437 RepID=A0A9P6NT47_9BASI|nr:hypothetical protein CROQUDRAFT_277512 [Cronartium quercuum f. sp. fusiforme G11]
MNEYGEILMALSLVVWFEVHVKPQETQTGPNSLILSLNSFLLYKPRPCHDHYNTHNMVQVKVLFKVYDDDCTAGPSKVQIIKARKPVKLNNAPDEWTPFVKSKADVKLFHQCIVGLTKAQFKQLVAKTLDQYYKGARDYLVHNEFATGLTWTGKVGQHSFQLENHESSELQMCSYDQSQIKDLFQL